MALILAAPLLTVARLILSKGVRQASKKYGPKLIKKTKDYISKNKLIWDGKKIIKPKAGSIKTVRPTNKKPATTKKPDALDKKADDIIKRVNNSKDDGKRILDNLDKSGTLFNSHIKSKFRTPQAFKQSILYNLKNKKNPKIKVKNKKIDDTKTVSNVNKPPMVAPNLKKAGKIGAGLVLGGLAIDQASKVLNNMSKSKVSEPSNFAAAFRKARKEKGTDSTFTYKGKQYSTVTMDEVKKAGFNTLREYLNAKKKKSTSSAPGK